MSFDETAFRKQVDESLKVVKTILDNNRAPMYPTDVFHKYDDKYMLINLLYVVYSFLKDNNCFKNKNCFLILFLRFKHIKL